MSDDRLRIQRNQGASGSCPTGKRVYVNRASAKAGAKFAARTGAAGMRPYQCPTCDQWHIGHKPDAVRRGDVSAADYYGGVA